MLGKLSKHAFVRYWQVHAWAGVITSLVVYVMFFLGAVVLFYEPLTVWEEPLKQRPAPELSSLQAPLDLAKPLPEEFIYYLPEHGLGLPKVAYFLPGTTKWRAWWLDESSGRAIAQRELAAACVYDLHYLWHEATGYWLQYGAGVLVFGFLLAIVTGVLIHLRTLVMQLHQFRPAEGPRVFWSDLHKVTGVFGLPFQLVYALTGTLMALSPLLFELSIGPVFDGDAQRATEVAGELVEEPPPLDYGPPQAGLSLDALVERAMLAEPRLTPESFSFLGYGRALATVDVRGPIQGYPFGDGRVRLRMADAVVMSVDTPDHERSVGSVARWIHGLHTVEYGGLAVRLLIFSLAIFGCVTILSGNWVWLERRHGRGESAGDAWLARLTAGVGGGAPLALAALFLASRLLPLSLASRTQLEQQVLAWVFVGCVLWALASRRSVSTWWRLLGLSGAVLAGVPLAGARLSDAGLFGAGPRQEQVVAVDVAFLLCSVLFFSGAAWLWGFERRRGPAVRDRLSGAVTSGADASDVAAPSAGAP